MTKQQQNDEGKVRNRGGIVNYALSFFSSSPVGKELKVDDKSVRNIYPVIPFYTEWNEFPVMLSLLAEAVPEHDAAIKAKRRWVIPSGFTVTKENPAVILNNSATAGDELIAPDQLAAVEQWLEGVNPDGDTMKDIVRNVVTDLETTGNAYIEIVKVRAANTLALFHHDATNVLLFRRLNKETKEEIITAGICPDWQRVEELSKEDLPVEELPLYRGKFTTWAEDEQGNQRAIMHIKAYRTGRYWYGLPDSIASLLSQKIGFEINRHNLDRLESDFFPRLFFEFFDTGGMTDEQQKKHLTALMDTFTKRKDKRFGIFAQYNEGENSKTNIQKLELDHQGDYVPLREQARQDILTAHGIHPVIAGVLTAGALGSSKEIKEAFDLFNNTVIEPLQEFIGEKLLNPVMLEAFNMGMFDRLYLYLNSVNPVNAFESIDLNRVVTINEAREEIGLPPMQTEDESGKMINDPRGEQIIGNERLSN